MEEKLKILVIDNNEVDRMAVCLALTKANIYLEVSEAINIDYALSKLQNTNFDCVFLDYCLPDQDSFTLIQKLSSLGVKIPIVILTAPEEEQTAIELIKTGATEYFFRDQISSENIPLIVRNTIRLHQANMKAELASQKLKESHQQLILKNQEIERQRQQIQNQNFQLIQASKLKSEFLATISHELRTPMNAIIGFSQILLRPKFGQLSYQQIDMVERILNNGKHLLALWDEILDFAQLESGELEFQAEIFDLSNIVNSAVAEIRSLVEDKNISLFVDTELENNWIFHDPMRIRQILISLLSNAVKFTEKGSIWLEIQEVPNNSFSIIVGDTGIGISPQDSENIFEAFRQLDQGLSRKYSGNGLGLAIINSLVKMMGGTIFVDSKLGVGSVFTIELPRKINVSSDLPKEYNLKFAGAEQGYYTQGDFSPAPSQRQKPKYVIQGKMDQNFQPCLDDNY
jgi:signal transduction histidine kinase